MHHDKKVLTQALNDRLIDINVYLDIEEPIRVVFEGSFVGVSFTIDVPQERTVRLLIESSDIESISWMDHFTVYIFDQTESRAKFVTSCKMLRDGMHSGYFGMFPHLSDNRRYYIQFRSFR